MLSVNFAVFIQIAIFVTVVLLCGPLLIKPTLKLLDERRENTEGARTKARELEEQNAERLRAIGESLGAARKEGAAEREKIRVSKAQQAEGFIAEARNESRKIVEEMRLEIVGETESARKTLRAEVASLAKEIAARLLGREVA